MTPVLTAEMNLRELENEFVTAACKTCRCLFLKIDRNIPLFTLLAPSVWNNIVEQLLLIINFIWKPSLCHSKWQKLDLCKKMSFCPVLCFRWIGRPKFEPVSHRKLSSISSRKQNKSKKWKPSYCRMLDLKSWFWLCFIFHDDLIIIGVCFSINHM